MAYPKQNGGPVNPMSKHEESECQPLPRGGQLGNANAAKHPSGLVAKNVTLTPEQVAFIDDHVQGGSFSEKLRKLIDAGMEYITGAEELARHLLRQ